MAIKLKICGKCKKEKSVTCFYRAINSRWKDKLQWACKDCDLIRVKLIQKQRYQKSPWLMNYELAKKRCANTNSAAYKNSGRKFLLSKDEVKELWDRDNAISMKVPSIDRINNDGNYEFSNCRFIEKSENTSKGSK